MWRDPLSNRGEPPHSTRRDELAQLRSERNAALLLAFICLAVALITAYLYDAYTEQLRDTLQSLLANRR
jgi:4-hydroxybenzoate polyprenyltransferase